MASSIGMRPASSGFGRPAVSVFAAIAAGSLQFDDNKYGATSDRAESRQIRRNSKRRFSGASRYVGARRGCRIRIPFHSQSVGRGPRARFGHDYIVRGRMALMHVSVAFAEAGLNDLHFRTGRGQAVAHEWMAQEWPIA
jgi:hypothetical protein